MQRKTIPLLAPPSIRRFLVSGLMLGVFATLPLAVHAQAPASPAAPTASEDPVVIDQIWQKGSAKYDTPSTTILNEVDRIAHLEDVGEAPEEKARENHRGRQSQHPGHEQIAHRAPL
jgi:hypothetical protein